MFKLHRRQPPKRPRPRLLMLRVWPHRVDPFEPGGLDRALVEAYVRKVYRGMA